MNGAWGASPKPRVPGVPPAVSAGGAGGLPDLPRDGRGRGVVSLAGLRGMGGIWRVERETQWARLHRSLGKCGVGVETADMGCPQLTEVRNACAATRRVLKMLIRFAAVLTAMRSVPG